MFSSDQYELLDVGHGRRLERFGSFVLDRPAPATVGIDRRRPPLWERADAHFERHSAANGVWSQHSPMPASWQINHESLVFELRCADSGAVGVFPEQAANWDWIARRVRHSNRRLRVLNLFAYSGGSTLAAAAAGAEVVHVDAAQGAVSWARRNAELAGLKAAPIRWITEDARKFAERELRRGARYDAAILDPPTYGHGPKAQPWKLTEHLAGLLDTIRALTHPRREFILLTCHTSGVGPPELEAMLADNLFGHCHGGVSAKRLFVRNRHGQRLTGGVVARWHTS